MNVHRVVELLRELADELERDERDERSTCEGVVSIWQMARSAAAGRSRQPVVYALQQTIGGAIKIGSTRSLEGRLRDLQAANPSPLRVLAAIRGTPGDERGLHATLATHRLHGEWFAESREVRAMVEELASIERGES